MPRPRILRRIFFEPDVNYFKPVGIPLRTLTEVVLTKPELEALRLSDVLDMEQEEAAKKMKISQPTFSRMLKEARKKISDALMNGKAIKIQGGTYKIGLAGPKFCVCQKCGFRVEHKRGKPCATMKCPRCGAIMTRE